MDTQPYWYFVPYDRDVQRALDQLRLRELEAGRYNPVMPRMHFGDPDLGKRHPGGRHASIAHAMADAGDDGTRSILDVDRVEPRPETGVAVPMGQDALLELFDTKTPSHDEVEEHVAELLAEIGPGQCVYLVVYAEGQPAELFFAGHSTR